MKISIFGLGYVGAVTAGCLAKRGHEIIGVDIHPEKVAALNNGLAPIFEPGLSELLEKARTRKLLRATGNAREAILASDVSFVCVGTPSIDRGSLDLSGVSTVFAEMAAVLNQEQKIHTIVIRSTLLPGSTEELVRKNFEGVPERIFYYPEFLREGSAVADFENPAMVVVGSHRGLTPAKELLSEIFGNATVVEWAAAEMVKFASNAFHASKIAFANEIGRLCKEMSIDGKAVMSLFCKDTKLNLSPYYLQPGNPFGGSCLPKDVRALARRGEDLKLELPLLGHLLPSNEAHLRSLLTRVLDSGEREIIILGLAFKSGTDDLRGSAMVELTHALINRGLTVRVFDPSVSLPALIGSNRQVVDTKLPELPSILKKELKEALGSRGLIVVAQPCVNIAELSACISNAHRILDVNGWLELRSLRINYEGLCW